MLIVTNSIVLPKLGHSRRNDRCRRSVIVRAAAETKDNGERSFRSLFGEILRRNPPVEPPDVRATTLATAMAKLLKAQGLIQDAEGEYR